MGVLRALLTGATGIDVRIDGGLGDRVLANIPGRPRTAEQP